MKNRAEADIYPARFVSAGATDGTVRQSVVDDEVCGISGQSRRSVREDAPIDFHANEGCPVLVHDGYGNEQDRYVMLELGAGVTYGDMLMPDADGKGITATAGKPVGAKAMQTGVAGEWIQVMPIIGAIKA